MNYKIQTVLAAATLIIAAPCRAEIAEQPATKTYTLTKIQQVVSNSDKCSGHLQDLKQLASKPISLQFSPGNVPDQHAVQHTDGELENHAHTNHSQRVQDSLVYRVSTGRFEVNKSPIDYVIQIAADVNNDKFQYLYPMTMAADHGRCFYTALVAPDAATVAEFKKHITSGAVANKTDLHKKG